MTISTRDLIWNVEGCDCTILPHPNQIRQYHQENGMVSDTSGATATTLYHVWMCLYTGVRRIYTRICIDNYNEFETYVCCRCVSSETIPKWMCLVQFINYHCNAFLRTHISHNVQYKGMYVCACMWICCVLYWALWYRKMRMNSLMYRQYAEFRDRYRDKSHSE